MMRFLEWTLILVIVWYISSTGFSLFLQEYYYLVKLNEINVNIYSIVCLAIFIQSFSCWVGISMLYLVFMIRNRQTNHSSISQQLADDVIKMTKRIQVLFIFASVLHCVGALLMNFMLTLSNIPCVHTIRALEPILATFLVCFIRMPNKNNRNDGESKIDNIEKWVGTLLILLGTILATLRSGQCDLLNKITFLGTLTNLVMVLRNICIQHISAETNAIFTQLVLYTISTLISFLLLVSSDFSYFLLKKYAILLCLTGVCGFIYNTASIIVCGKVTLISHSLLTMLKRPTLIIASSIYFHSPMSLAMFLGNFIILIGITLYKINVLVLLSISRKVLYFILLSLLVVCGIVMKFPAFHYAIPHHLPGYSNNNVTSSQ